jgi:DNA repair protein RecO (recombination protein O)
MSIIKTEGILIKKYKYKEKDKLLTIFTPEQGKILALCKGARNPLNKWGCSTEPPNFSFFQLYERNGFHTLTEIKVLDNFSFLTSDFSRLLIFDYFANIIDWFLPLHSPSRNTFSLLSSSLYLLNDKKVNFIILSYFFLLKFINIQGYKVDLKICTNCKRKVNDCNNFYFCAEEGGLICSDCLSKTESSLTNVSKETISILNELIFLDLNNISSMREYDLLKNLEIDKILTGYYSFVFKRKIMGISEILKKTDSINEN